MGAVKRAIVKYDYEEVMSLLDPLVARWFRSRFAQLTEPQAFAIPLIAEGRNVLVSSPTGTGKTLTAFLWILSELISLGRRGRLEDRVYAVYISPLRALANDIRRNLIEPLEEMREMAEEEGEGFPEIRVAVRTGDTPQSERQRMLRKPPHIFITTPESLSLALSAPKFRKVFQGVRWVIVDEIHEISSSKRGVMLSLNLERLQYRNPGIQRIGLSATQAPIEEIAKFLGGLEDGEFREVYIVEVRAGKDLDLKVITPVKDMTETPFEVASERMYDILTELVKSARTTLIFTNTRSGTESVSFKLRQRGIESLEAHHGSLSRAIRLSVEDMLKAGKLKAVVTSTSLELGIDIGYIDQVVQIGSPKSVAKAVQRIGRSGHAYRSVARGFFIPLTLEDLQEVVVISRAAKEHKIDRIRIPENSLDVLAQVITGMALEQKWDAREAFRIIKRSYCFRNLSWEKFLSVLRYLSGKVYEEEIYGRIWFDEEEMVFGRKRSTRVIYFPNVGTIPDEADYQVLTQDGRVIGYLSEAFVEKLRPGDVFVLGSRTYEFKRLRGSRVFVIDAMGRRPTVPSWVGEMLPRSFDLSIMVGEFREWLSSLIAEGGDPVQEITSRYPVDEWGARALVKHFKEQIGVAGIVPSHRNLLIEGYIDNEGKYNIIFHFPFGRRVNDALSRAFAEVISNRYRTSVRITVTDDAFMLTTYRKVPLKELPGLIGPGDLEPVLREALAGTELFKQRFRHVATRALMVLRNYRGRDISVTSQQLRSERLLRLLQNLPDFPVVEETYNEILNIVMDLPNARKVLEAISTGEAKVHIRDYSEIPSPFSYHVILSGVSDVVLISDKSALLRELHARILERVLGREEIAKMYEFPEEAVREHFRRKFLGLNLLSAEGIEKFLRLSLAAELKREKGFSIFSFLEVPRAAVLEVVKAMEKMGRIIKVSSKIGSYTVPELVPILAALYSVPVPKEMEDEAAEVLRILREDGPQTVRELSARLGVGTKRLRNVLRLLHSAYAVSHRPSAGGELYFALEFSPADRDEALERAVIAVLGREGPMTMEELVARLGLPHHEVSETVGELVGRGKIVKGRFTPSWDVQYMLTEDYVKLREETKRGPGLEEVLRASIRNSLKTVEDVETFFTRYVIATSITSVASRTRRFKLRDLVEEMLNDWIVFLKTPAGRTYLVRRDHARILAGIVPKTRLSELEEAILGRLRELGKSDPEELSILLGAEPQEVREALGALAEKMLVVRTVYGSYLPNDPVGDPTPILRKIALAYGPLSDKDFETLLGVPGLTSTLEDIQRVPVSGTMYFGPFPVPEGEEAEVIPSDDMLVVLRPGFIPVPESGFIFPESGTMVLVSREGGTPRIEGIEGPLDAADAVPEVYSLLRKLGWRGVTLSREVARSMGIGNGETAPYGEIDMEVPKEDIVRWVFSRSRLDPKRHEENAIKLLEEMGSIRLDLEILNRCWRTVRLDDILKSGLAVQGYGVPKLIGIVDPSFASKLTYICLGRVSNSAVEAHRSCIGGCSRLREEYLNYLFSKRIVYRDASRRYVSLRPIEATHKEVLEKIFNFLGAANPHRISRILGELLPEDAIRAYLDELVEEGRALIAFSDGEIWWVSQGFSKGDVGQNVVHAHDMVFMLFEDEVRRVLPRANMAVLDGGRVALALRVRKVGNGYKIDEMEGDPSYLDVIRSILSKAGLFLEEA